MDVAVVVRGQLEAHVEDLPEQALELIKSALTFPNEDREIAAREQVFGWWDMPETIPLWKVEARRSGETLVMPRGFASKLVAGMKGIGHRIAWDDQRVSPAAAEGYFQPFLLRDYQIDAVADLIKSHQGFFECPAGGGKTVTMLGLAAMLGLRTLVIVDKADLLDQWREEAQDFLKLCIDDGGDFANGSGKIGQDIWVEQDFTVALRQALWAKMWELDATAWWEQWGLVIFDEGHHLASDTLGEIVRRAPAQFLFGASATPAKTETKGKIVHALVGPVVHRTSRALLRDKGILMMPFVQQIATDFEADFWITHDAVQNRETMRWDCQVPGCNKGSRKHSHRNNYSSAVKKLVESDERNDAIAQSIVRERGHIHLVPSRQLKHLDRIRTALELAGWDGPIFYLRGEENARKESRDIVAQIRESEEAVVLSTVADEALNIPPIDRIHIVFPMRQQAAVEQLVGRCERAWPDKELPVVQDWVDVKMEVFRAQALEREIVYRRQGYPLTPLPREMMMAGMEGTT